MVDAPERRTGRVVTSVSLSGSDVELWFEAFCTAGVLLEGADGITGFRSTLVETATDSGLRTPAEDFERYLNQDSSIDESLLKTLVAYGAGPLHELYDALAPYDWISDESWDALSDLWSERWIEILDDQLTDRWGAAWQDNPDAHKQAWLDNLIPEFVLGGVSEDEGDPESPAADMPAPDPAVVAEQSGDLIRQAVATYEAQNPGVTVPQEVAIRLYDQLAAARASQSPVG
jgi:hypothetical protein